MQPRWRGLKGRFMRRRYSGRIIHVIAAALCAAACLTSAQATDLSKSVVDRSLPPEEQAALARDVESFGKATTAPGALILAARMWAALGARADRDRALDLATRAAAGDAALLRTIASLRAADLKGVLFAPPVSLAPGESIITRSRVESGGARASVTASLPMPIRLVVTDGSGAELCSATGGAGGAECGWTAAWAGDVTLSILNLGEDRLSAWTITRSADKDERRDEGKATWR